MDQYQNYLEQDATGNGFNMELHDTMWFPKGIPLLFLAMHNTKITEVADGMVNKISKATSTAVLPSSYIVYNRKWYSNPTTLPANTSRNRPCLLV
jgi:hypothetical protein